MSSVSKITPDDNKHYFFGFHDLSPSNTSNTKYLALQTDCILAPPNGDKSVNFGIIVDKEFVILGKTFAYNFPQGARQQWIYNSDMMIINSKNSYNWCSIVIDTDSRKEVYQLENSCHCITNQGTALGVDYSRLHRLGGYGYTGFLDKTLNENAPRGSGITAENIHTGKKEILISVFDVANFEMSDTEGKDHYLTHLVLSPNQDNVAFLHRYRFKDGGEGTRLMVVNMITKNLNCILSGSLSHFDWVDDENITIWGSTSNNILGFRKSSLYKYIPEDLLFYGKKIYHKKQIISRNSQSPSLNTHSWMKAHIDTKLVDYNFSNNSIDEDGHPMFCPTNRDWLVCDNYPNKFGIRTLFLYNYKTSERFELGKFKMLDILPNMQESRKSLVHVNPKVLRQFSIEKMAFYRSGIHCDLHPRWSICGNYVSFDSIHEGKRAIYSVKVENIID